MTSPITISVVLVVLLSLIGLNGSAFALLVVKEDPKSIYPFVWEKDNGSFSKVPKSKEEQKYDEDLYPGNNGLFGIRRLFRKKKKYVFYVRNEDEERHARLILTKDKDADVKKENAFLLNLWKIPLKWVTIEDKSSIKSIYKISPSTTKQIVVSAKDREAYLSLWINYNKPGSLLNFWKNEKGLYFNAAKNVELDMKSMNYAIRKKQFEYTGSTLCKYSNVNRRFEAKK